MSVLNSILKIFVGNKAKKDLKEISPIVLSINSLEENYSNISNDELRNKTNEFKKEIKSLKKPFQDKIDVLNGNISNESEIEKKEKLYNDIEEIEQNFLDEIHIEKSSSVVIKKDFDKDFFKLINPRLLD